MKSSNFFCALVLGLAYTPHSHAASADSLWSEKGASAPQMAQVPNFSALAQQVTPAVVSLQVDQKVKVSRQGAPFGGEVPPGLEFFFRGFGGGGGGGGGGSAPQEYHNQGIGSGLVIRDDGLVLTNYHVVENADEIEVTFETEDGNKETKPGKVLGKAPEYDVALVQVQDVKGAPIAFLGDSDSVHIGDWVMAVGTPFGLSHSVSVGIISAKERREIAPSGRTGLYDFLQTDASINPGNSGGPLINMRGEVIGINTAINASGSGIGFAIPINMVKAMVPQLRSTGAFARSYIGVKIQPLTDALAQSYGIKKGLGALVAEVVPHSPAATAGLKEGDIIQRFDGKPIRQSSDLPLLASMAGVGKKVDLEVWRDNKARTIQLKLEQLPGEKAAGAALEGAEQEEQGQELGMTVSDVTPQLQERLQLESTQGAAALKVDPVSPAARAGIRPGDVIVAANDQPIGNAKALLQVVRKAKSGEVLRLRVQRQDGRFFTGVRKP